MKISNSIKLKLNISFVFLISMLLGLSGVYNYFQQKDQLESQFSSQVNASLSRLSNSLPEPVWNYETDMVASIIGSEMTAQGVKSIIAWSGEDVIYGSNKDDSQTLTQTSDAPAKFTKELSQELTVVEDEEKVPVGKLALFTDDSHIRSALSHQLIVTVIEIAVLDIIIVACLSWLLSSSVLNRLSRVTDAISDIADGEGDLTCRIEDDSKDELGQLCDSFNAVIKKLQAVMLNVADDATQLADTAQETSQITEQTTKGVNSLKHETSQVAAAIHQMSVTTKEVAESAAQAADSARIAQEEANNGYDTLHETIEDIGKLSKDIEDAEGVIKRVAQDSDSISSILGVIRSIAEQINMLALNAAIESARAGEQGRGFAVVADEVRTLALRTQQATEEIQTMIESLQAGTSEAVIVTERAHEQAGHVVHRAEKTGQGIKEITASVEEIAQFTTQIAQATDQQSTVAGEVDRNIENISDITQETAIGADNTAQATEQLAELAVNLQGVVGQFKVQ
ncbi:methyl-accepting chemotaxis protein [Shewanella gelidii]|uniref:Methyl-accepting chemotaxis protein n=1 Tax=Shewanella gelidii TaxID=1642821 RepID=A0A917JN61_9GAMM|nr:methyl-accepting chemotaxis protein [Shewanella gelidii]MCL1097335.1 methyl-accepting chemotaxis protein [Shewanella gelidii]GGI74327.1 hypothetical protein GCM10009332_09770 [Shewanella gelidii]